MDLAFFSGILVDIPVFLLFLFFYNPFFFDRPDVGLSCKLLLASVDVQHGKKV
jgi:hypothetical protein